MSDASKANRTRNLRYKRPALASMGYDFIRPELWEIQDACTDIHYYIDHDDDTLLNALDGDDEAVWEFKLAFADLEAKVERLIYAIGERCDYDGFPRMFDDCTVALVGDQYDLVGYDSLEEDYFSLCSYDEKLAQTEAGRRLMRLTKAEMRSTIGQCVKISWAFLDLRQQYDYLKATFDILRDENTSLLKQIKEIDSAYSAADAVEWYEWKDEVKRFDRLLAALPDRAWVE